MLKGKTETVQDELALYSSLLLQDALSDQKMSWAEVEEFAAFIQKQLCGGKQPSDCASASRDIALIKGLYRGAAISDQATNGAVVGLMSAVVLWLDINAHDLPIPK